MSGKSKTSEPYKYDPNRSFNMELEAIANGLDNGSVTEQQGQKLAARAIYEEVKRIQRDSADKKAQYEEGILSYPEYQHYININNAKIASARSTKY